MSGPSSIGEKDPLDGFGGDDTESIMSFSSSTATMGARRPHTHQLGTKVINFDFIGGFLYPQTMDLHCR